MKSLKTITLLFSLLCLSLLQFACSDSSTNSTPVPGVYKIVFSHDVANNEQNDIYTINPDGTELTQLTFATSTSSNSSPIWSPDGDYIYYKDFMDEANEIIRMNSDGTHKINLTNYSGLDRLCDISPDGTKMAFISNRNDSWDLYVMNLDSMTYTNITTGDTVEGRTIMFTPDGQQLLCSIYRGSQYDLCLYDIDGNSRTILSNLTYDDTSPSVSPDGQKIAYMSKPDDSLFQELWVCSIDGNDRVKISSLDDKCYEPKWSPNSQKIAYTKSIVRDSANIIVVNVDGTNPVCLTDSTGLYYSPRWSPDGTQIAYISRLATSSEMYIMNSDGTEKLRLTNTLGNGMVYELSWSPGL